MIRFTSFTKDKINNIQKKKFKETKDSYIFILQEKDSSGI